MSEKQNPKLSEIAQEQSKLEKGIKDIENYLDEAEVTEEYKQKLNDLLSELFEKRDESKEAIKSKLNNLCYALKKQQSEIELKKTIKRDLENSIKAMEHKNEWLKDFLYYYANQFFNVDEATLRLDWFSVGTGTTKDKLEIDKMRVPDDLKREVITLEIDNNKVKEYLKENGNQDWGRCFDNKYLIIRGGNALRTHTSVSQWEECKIKEEKEEVGVSK